MRLKNTIFLVAILFSTSALANDICSNVKSEKISDKSIRIEINGRKFRITAPHSIVDFSISRSGDFVVVYGGYYPQEAHENYEISSAASVFRIRISRKAVKTVVVGRGIYEILFDNKEDNIYIVAKYGTIKVDTLKFRKKDLGKDFEKMNFNQYDGACKHVHLSRPQ